MPHVATKAKGRYKPQQSDFALTVRQTLDWPYADRGPSFETTGAGCTSTTRKGQTQAVDDYTNRALMWNLGHGVPVAVLSSPAKPNVRYKVLGLGTTRRWRRRPSSTWKAGPVARSRC